MKNNLQNLLSSLTPDNTAQVLATLGKLLAGRQEQTEAEKLARAWQECEDNPYFRPEKELAIEKNRLFTRTRALFQRLIDEFSTLSPTFTNMDKNVFRQRFQVASQQEMPELLEILHENYSSIPSYQKTPYSGLYNEFFNQPNNFTFTGWQGRFRAFLNLIWDEMPATLRVPEHLLTPPNPIPSTSNPTTNMLTLPSHIVQQFEKLLEQEHNALVRFNKRYNIAIDKEEKADFELEIQNVEHNIKRLETRFLNENRQKVTDNELQKIWQEMEARIIAKISQAESNIQQSLQDLAEATRQSLPQESQAYLQELKEAMKALAKEQIDIIEELLFDSFEEVKADDTNIQKALVQITPNPDSPTHKIQWELGLPFLFKVSSEKGLNGWFKKTWDKINYWIPQNLKRPKP